MPLVALDRTTGRRFVLDGVPDPETQLGGRDIRCPVCETPLALRRTPGCPPSFRHTEASSCEGVSHPESPEHDGAKRQVRQLAAEALRPLTSAPLEYEVWVPEAGRLADLLQLFRCGWGIAYEVQLTPIAAPELARRTDAYARAGLDVHWFLGADADTPENRAWALRRTGITTRLDEHATVPGVGGGVLWGAPLAPRAWLRRSLHRFFEIWRRSDGVWRNAAGRPSSFRRGLHLEEGARSIVSGLFGIANGRILERSARGVWTVLPCIPASGNRGGCVHPLVPLPAEGIVGARARASQMTRRS